mmetsp:Transcript_33391/g.92366  ORF Transcript_33391/g.92366 Transcript_33391/m.92366 type:complete len:377 (+) Transcript_33391:371-1501(+)
MAGEQRHVRLRPLSRCSEAPSPALAVREAPEGRDRDAGIQRVGQPARNFGRHATGRYVRERDAEGGRHGRRGGAASRSGPPPGDERRTGLRPLPGCFQGAPPGHQRCSSVRGVHGMERRSLLSHRSTRGRSLGHGGAIGRRLRARHAARVRRRRLLPSKQREPGVRPRPGRPEDPARQVHRQGRRAELLQRVRARTPHRRGLQLDCHGGGLGGREDQPSSRQRGCHYRLQLRRRGIMGRPARVSGGAPGGRRCPGCSGEQRRPGGRPCPWRPEVLAGVLHDPREQAQVGGRGRVGDPHRPGRVRRRGVLHERTRQDRRGPGPCQAALPFAGLRRIPADDRHREPVRRGGRAARLRAAPLHARPDPRLSAPTSCAAP